MFLEIYYQHTIVNFGSYFGIIAGNSFFLIKDKLPDQLKLPYGLWTREAVQGLIFKKYGIELSRWQVGRYLKAWGYTPQKPISSFSYNIITNAEINKHCLTQAIEIFAASYLVLRDFLLMKQ